MAGINTGERVKYGIVAYAFGLREEAQEPNPSNLALGRATKQAYEKYRNPDDGSYPIVVSQWEITKGLKEFFLVMPDHSVELHADGSYLDSDDVWEEARKVFHENHVTHIIVIAQPWLHLPALKGRVTKDGFTLVKFKVGRIPFDRSKNNTQWWTRSRWALLRYALKTLLPGAKHGYGGRQNAT